MDNSRDELVEMMDEAARTDLDFPRLMQEARERHAAWQVLERAQQRRKGSAARITTRALKPTAPHLLRARRAEC